LIVSSLPVDEGVLKGFKNVEGRDIVGSPSLHVETASKFWPHVEEALRKGDLLPIPHKVAPGGLAGVAEALQSVKKASGYKVVVHPQE
jgi:hypothetical protein